MKSRHFFGPTLVHGAYLTEITAFILILHSWDFSSTQKEWLFAVYSIALCIALPVGGLLSDWRGPRFAYLLGGVLFFLSCALMILSEAYVFLLLTRIFQGLGAGICSPVIPVLLTPKASESGQNLAHWGTFSSLFSASAPLLMAGLSDAFSWQVAWLIVPMIAFFGLCLGTAKGSQPILVERQSICNRQISAVLVMVAFSFGCSTLVVFSIPAITGAGLFSGVMLFTLWISAAIASAALSSRLTQDNAWSLTCSGAALNVLALLSLLQPMPLVAAVFCGIGIGMTNAPTTFLVLHYASPGRKGLGSSMDIISARLGGGIAVLLFGSHFAL